MGIRRVRPKAGAIDAINRLIAAGYTVFVLTDRKKQSFDALIQWFAERGTHMPPSQFHLIITDEVITKQAVVDDFTFAGYDIVAVVDDAPHHMEAYTDLHGDFRVYSFRYPYNDMQITKGLAEEITSWAAFTDKVIDES